MRWPTDGPLPHVPTDPLTHVLTCVCANRSAIFMIAFLLIHSSSNLAFFMGRDTFNGWSHALTQGVVGSIVMVVEYYLALAVVCHIVPATFLTLKFNKLAIPKKGGIAAWPFGTSSSKSYIAPLVFQNGLQAKSGFEMCFDIGSQHLGCWGQNTSRIQNKGVYATLCLQARPSLRLLASPSRS